MGVDISYFSIASILALFLFILVIIPRSLGHMAAAAWRRLRGRKADADAWLIAIGLLILLCAAMAGAVIAFSDRAHRLLNASAAVTFSFLFFAMPAVLQVLRAWSGHRARRDKVLSHALVALAVLSLPASMAVPTAALMRVAASAQPNPAPADNPAAAIADEQYFTDSEVANDPEDYPVASFLDQNLSWRTSLPSRRRGFLAEVPAFTAFWFDETTNMLTFDATDTFGVLVSRITHVRANWAFSLVVWAYKLLCALVLVAVTFDVFLRPLTEWVGRARRKAPGG